MKLAITTDNGATIRGDYIRPARGYVEPMNAAELEEIEFYIRESDTGEIRLVRGWAEARIRVLN